jgi:hypothetical protein
MAKDLSYGNCLNDWPLRLISTGNHPRRLTQIQLLASEVFWGETIRPRSTPDLVQLLKETLKRLEQTEELQPNDPALVELKQSIVRTIAELEVAKSGKSASA